MKLNSSYVKDLFYERGWSQNELARQMGISKGTLSDAINGKTGVGRKFIRGLSNVFPDEKFENMVGRKNINPRAKPIEQMPIKVEPYTHQVNAYNFAGKILGIFKEVM